jgi:hypothetical protein
VKRRGSRVEDLLVALRGAFERGGWQGPSVLESLAGVGPAAAGKRPRGVPHSVHDLVEHIAFWEERGVTYLRPGPKQLRADWSLPGRSYRASLARLKKVHALLVRSVGRLREGDLDRIVSTGEGDVTLARALHGVAAHDAYHAGQIGLIAKRLL